MRLCTLTKSFKAISAPAVFGSAEKYWTKHFDPLKTAWSSGSAASTDNVVFSQEFGLVSSNFRIERYRLLSFGNYCLQQHPY